MSMAGIEDKTLVYAQARERLAAIVTALHDALEALKRDRMPELRQAVQQAAQAEAELKALIEAAPDLFDKPRTRILHGVRVGFMKQRGQVLVADEAATVARIRKLLPAAQAELLIRVRESVHKPAVYDLQASDLKRLGIAVEADTDAVVVKPTDSAVDRLVAALLDAAAETAEAA